MSKKSTRIKGARRLQAILKNIPDLAEEQLQKSMEKHSQDLLGKAQSRAPVDTGALKNALSRKVNKKGTGFRVGILTASAKRKAWYAHFVEFGTKGHKVKWKNKNGSASIPAMPPRPYLWNSWREIKDSLIQDWKRGIRTCLNEARHRGVIND